MSSSSYPSSLPPPFPTPHLLPTSIVPIYQTSQTRLLLFDYDGTLTPIIPHPPSATLPQTTRHHLALLAANPKNSVWIISGRDCAFLEQELGNISPQTGLCAEHGAFIRRPGDLHWRPAREAEEYGWRSQVIAFFEKLVKAISGSELEAKQATVAWHFRRATANPQDVARQAREEAKTLREAMGKGQWEMEVMEGKCVIEVRPKAMNKGWVVGGLMKPEGAAWDFVACWGDDLTDEDMFHALAESSLAQERVFAVKVGDGSAATTAKWIVDDPAEVLRCMQWLTEADMDR